ncbi:MAG TPA: cupin domain-containing protein [Phycisphaerales bacterium]|nr:cupin domain-containing protein [Phycisphaerales bacterium]
MTTPAAPSASPCAKAACLSASEGEFLSIVGDRVRILADGSASAGACAIFETTTGIGNGPPLHVHTREDEYFYVIDGTAKFSVDGRTVTCTNGAFVAAPRGSKHTFVNAGERPLRMLVMVTPCGLEAPFRANAELFRTTPDASPAQIAAIFAEHGLEFVGPPLSPTVG